MKWGTKKKNPITKSKEEEEVVVEEINTKQPPSSSSSSSSSSTFSLSSWFSKILLKPPRATSNPQPVIPKRNSAPTAKPLLSPPPLPPRAGDITPRRLSIGDDQTHLARTRTQSLPHRSHRRHISLGSELDFMPESPHLRKLRVDPDQVRSGRRSFGGKVRPKVRVHSPRLASLGARRGLERFAVVKRSRDPVRDFRESMVEMIWEKGIGRPDELEKLLACYLSLNSDEHHDVIVKVFRQVWFDLNRDMVRLRDRFDPA